MTQTATASRTKATEREFHDEMYAHIGVPKPIDVDSLRSNTLRPCYEGTGDAYSENRQAFHEVIAARGGWEGMHVLDYACGPGHFASYFALTGAARVDGFDLSEVAIDNGQQRVAAEGLSDRVTLTAMDASNLTYPDETFDVVIGHGVIHHVIKYPHIFEHLHRVMKPGAKAFFLEGLADNPLFHLWWVLKGNVPQGDVPIYTAEIERRASMFSSVEVIGDTLVHSAKRFLYRPHPNAWRRAALRATHTADKVLFRLSPGLRRWGSFSYIVLTK